MLRRIAVFFLLIASAAAAEESNGTALTIYNQNFAVVRSSLFLDVKPGLNNVRFAGATAFLEPDSVVLRDPRGERRLTILEQSYRNDPISQEYLLELNVGQTIEFERWHEGKLQRFAGRVVRSGYASPPVMWNGQYLPQVASASQPIIEVDGRLHFGLPGTPVFSSLGSDTILKPRLDWLLHADAAARFPAEVSYITGGMRWKADYNIVAPEKGDLVDIVGWVTIDNRSGKQFEDARIKLLAGDVHKIQRMDARAAYKMAAAMEARDAVAPQVTTKAFDEYHLYYLPRPLTLRDRETKQVEFVRASGVRAERLYVYDGAQLFQYAGWNMESIRNNPEYGTQSNKKVWVMREFVNSKKNNLGMALPAGNLRFYRRDDDGQMEFTGENLLAHTPEDETVRVYTGDSFDLVGERKRTDFKVDHNADWADESFEIRLRNHKAEPVEIRVVEHLYRWTNWKLTAASHKWKKLDAQTIEYRVTVPAKGERVVTYTVHYSW
jgi:hypothetical protein